MPTKDLNFSDILEVVKNAINWISVTSSGFLIISDMSHNGLYPQITFQIEI